MSLRESAPPGVVDAPPLAGAAVASRAGGGQEEAGWLPVGGERVFTVLHRPARPRAAVVVVSPLLAELVTNYRREVQLARHLADQGCLVARFHPRGTGRSTGAPQNVTVDDMVRDTAAVVDRVTSEVAGPVVMVGTRVGATVAAMAAPDRPLAAWAPVLDHRRYLRDVLRSLYLHALKEDVAAPTGDLRERLVRDGVVDVFGYGVHRVLHDSLLAVDPREVLARSPGALLVVEITLADRVGQGAGRHVRELAARRPVDVRVVTGQEAWWFSTSGGRERPVDPTGELVSTTAAWVRDVVEGRA